MSKYQVSVVNFSEKTLVGMKVNTTMQKAAIDCPAIWQTFGPRIIELSSASCEAQNAYGISIMRTPHDFEYWAAAEAGAMQEFPLGMEEVTIPTGEYACCIVENLAKLSDAYEFLFTAWLFVQAQYMYDETRPFFELYPPNWRLDSPLRVYMGVMKK